MINSAKYILLTILVTLLAWALHNHSGGPLLAQQDETLGPQAVVTPLLQFQGRLSDPDNGQPLNGTFQMSFSLYNVQSGGSALWSETDNVQVDGGLFSTVLGDTNPLGHALFNGQALWLGIAVEGDGEAVPRQQILPVAYAVSLVPGAIVEGSSAPVLAVKHSGGAEALQVEGNLNVTGSLTGGSHTHSGGHITSGTVAAARIDGAMARDSEIMPAVLAGDGPGSGLNADLLDGYTSSSFAYSNHSHTGLLARTTVLNVTCTGLQNFTTSWLKIVDVGTFSKLSSSSTVEVTFNGRISANTMTGTGAKFELRVDNAPTSNGRARAIIKSSEAGPVGEHVTITGIFTGLGSGTHTVSVWVLGTYGGGTQAYVDNGCWTSDTVVIKEFR